MDPTPLANSTEARSTEGTILDQSQTQTTPPTSSTTETTPNDSTTTSPVGAPDKYEFTPPDGAELDPKTIESATAVFKELGLTQAQANKLVEFQFARDAEIAKKPAEVYNQMRADWREAVEKDPQIGGQKLDETRAEIGKAIATLPAPLQKDFKDAMNLTGAGDNPAIVKAFLAFAKSVNESTKHVAGGNPSPMGQNAPGGNSKPTPAAAMFPNLPSASTAH